MKGQIFNIQKFCTSDGPGIRTTVFLKGCPLRCAWCHNPESHTKNLTLLYDAEKCIGCGACISVCPVGAHSFENQTHIFDRTKCTLCGACANKCYADALESFGKEMTSDGIITEVMKDKAFYDNSGGGLTLSGGEPLMQFDFAYDILKKAKDVSLHTCVETCGYVPTENILKIAEFTDIFLYDWKLTDSELHKKYTGVGNELIAENLKMLDSVGAKTILRCPIIPSVNDTSEHLLGIARLADSLKNLLCIEIEPYHSLGKSKYERSGKTKLFKNFETPSESTIEKWITEIQKHTAVNVKRS